jgi:hypothetical protein
VAIAPFTHQSFRDISGTDNSRKLLIYALHVIQQRRNRIRCHARNADRIRRRTKCGPYNPNAIVDSGPVLIGTDFLSATPTGNSDDQVVLRFGIEQPGFGSAQERPGI